MNQSIVVKKLVAHEITSEQFRPFGQVIWAAEDGKQFDKSDAQLNLENGQPRFYSILCGYMVRSENLLKLLVMCNVLNV